MDWGLQNRIAQIIKPTDNRALMLAVDHGYFLGPTEKLEVPRKAISPLLKYCDSLMLTRGVQRTSVNPKFPTPIVLRVSGGSSIIGADLSNEEITVSIKDAIRLNACALAMSIFVGSKYEKQTIVNLGKLVSEAEEFGIPVLAVTADGKEGRPKKLDKDGNPIRVRVDTYGVSTLQARHIKVSKGGRVSLEFIGKSGKTNYVNICHPDQ